MQTDNSIGVWQYYEIVKLVFDYLDKTIKVYNFRKNGHFGENDNRESLKF